MKKIVFIVTSAQSVNTFTGPQIKSISSFPSKIYLICGEGMLKDEIKEFTESIIQLPSLLRKPNLFFDLIALIQITIILHKLKPDLAVYSTPKASFLGSIASKVVGVKSRLYQIWGAWWINDGFFQYHFSKTIDRITIGFSNHVTVVSSSLGKFYDEQFNAVIKNKLTLICHGSTTGVNSKLFYFKSLPYSSDKETVIGYAGRLSKEKGLDDLVLIFTEMSQKVKNLKLEIIGNYDMDDPVSLKTKHSINNNNLVRQIPEMSQILLAEKMKLWTLQIFLSKREGLGNVVIEAAACGVPTIAWDIIGVRDAIPHWLHKKMLIPFNDFDGLKIAIQNYLDYPFDVKTRLDLSNWATTKFDQAKLEFDFCKFLEKVLS